jgi:hypothetical protein
MSEHVERNILGAILWENQHYWVVGNSLAPGDFFLDTHQRLYSKIGAMLDAGELVDIVTLLNALGGEIDKLGGSAYIASLTEGLPRGHTAENVAAWVVIVAKAAALRRARADAEELVRQLNVAGEEEVDAVYEAFQERVKSSLHRRLKARTRMFESALAFAARPHATVPWIIEGIVPESGNGIIGGDPKASKSMASSDMGLSVACGVSWMGHYVAKPLRVGIVSREDAPGLTHRRLNRLIRGRANYSRLRESDMYINTREQTADFKVTDRADMDQLIDELGESGVGLVVLDVFRLLHDNDENSNNEVSMVLSKVSRIQQELKCACLLVHHITKVEGTNPFKSLRGASCLHGWMEYALALSVTNPEEEDRANFIRRVQFESKEATTRDVYYRIVGSNREHEAIRLEQMEPGQQQQRTRGKVSSILPPPRDGKNMAAGG